MKIQWRARKAWERPDGWGFGEENLVAIGENDEGVGVEVWFSFPDDNGRAALVVYCGDKWFSTEKTKDWPQVEAVIPRSEWPREVPAGRRGGEHDCCPELRKIIDEWKREVESTKEE